MPSSPMIPVGVSTKLNSIEQRALLGEVVQAKLKARMIQVNVEKIDYARRHHGPDSHHGDVVKMQALQREHDDLLEASWQCLSIVVISRLRLNQPLRDLHF